MSKTRDLWCRNGRWYFRKRLPKDVRKSLGKEHFTQALNTSDREEALRKRPLAEIEFNNLVDRTRRSITPDGREVSEAELIGMIRSWFREAAEAELPTFDPEGLDHHLDLLQMLKSDYREYFSGGNFRPVRNHIKSLMKEEKVDLREGSEAYKTLGRFMLRGMIENIRMESAHLTGDYTYLPADSLFQEALASPQTTINDHMTFGQLIEAYEEERSSRWAPKTLLDYAGRFKLLREVIGKTRKVSTIDRAVCRKVRDVVAAIPPNHTKLKDMAGMTAPKAAEYAKRKGLTGLKPKTANSYLILLSSMFRWAVREEYMARNPAGGLHIADDVAKKDKRQPFSTDELKAIFAAPLYTGSKRQPAASRGGRFWVPLVALWTGMRQGEICQLLVSDVREVDGVDCIVITADGGDEGDKKRVKTKSGERFVPVHPELRKIGFNKYVSEMREGSGGRLFPDITKGALNGDPWGPFSGWFRRFLKSVNVKTPTNNFHSFRHTYRDALREADISTERVRALGGWASTGGVEDDYGKGLSAKALYKEIKKIGYEGLELGHLRIE